MKNAFLCLFLISYNAFSSQTVIKISKPNHYLPGHISVFLDNGEIIHISKEDKASLEVASKSKFYKESIVFKRQTKNSFNADIASSFKFVNSENKFSSSMTQKEMYNPARFQLMGFSSSDPMEHSRLTKLESYNEAKNLLMTFNNNTRNESQCYNRAHVWSYQSLLKQNVTLGKAWVFFTDTYIKQYNYKWWFHVAPFTDLANGKRYVLDRSFSTIPLSPRDWTNKFVRPKPQCPTVKKYADYEQNQEAELCYTMFTSQYYWQPWNIEILGKDGLIAFGYKMRDLEIAFKDALVYWNGEIESLPEPTPQSNDPVIISEIEDERAETIITEEVEAEEIVVEEVTRSRTTNHRSININSDLKIGEVVINTEKDNVKVKVVSQKPSGYEIYYLEGRFKGQTGGKWGRKDLARMEGCSGDFCVNDVVINTDRSSVKTKIIAIQNNGNIVLQFLEGTLKGKRGHNWTKSDLARMNGCSGEFCVGDVVLNTDKKNVRTKIVAIQNNGNLVLKFLEGSLKGKKGHNWTRKDLAKRSGCSNYLCVGNLAYNTEKKNAKVEVVGIQYNGKHVVKFLDGSLKGKKGHNWTSNDLAKNEGCYNGICVGDEKINIKRDNSKVKILGIQTNNNFVLKFLSGSLRGQRGHNWSSRDLQ